MFQVDGEDGAGSVRKQCLVGEVDVDVFGSRNMSRTHMFPVSWTQMWGHGFIGMEPASLRQGGCPLRSSAAGPPRDGRSS
jgi:hypothetical protein